MQLCRLAPPGRKSFRLGVIGAVDQAHKLVHHVAMKPGRPKVCSATSQRGGKIPKSTLAVPGIRRRRRQHGVDGWVGMVETYRVDAVERRQVVLVRRVVSMPADHVERRMVDLAAQSLPRNFATIWKLPSRSSKLATGVKITRIPAHWRRSVQFRQAELPAGIQTSNTNPLVDLSGPKFAQEFRNNLEASFTIFKTRYGS